MGGKPVRLVEALVPACAEVGACFWRIGFDLLGDGYGRYALRLRDGVARGANGTRVRALRVMGVCLRRNAVSSVITP